jgi:hypothetical protein
LIQRDILTRNTIEVALSREETGHYRLLDFRLLVDERRANREYCFHLSVIEIKNN